MAKSADERRSIIHRIIEPTSEDFEQGRKTPTKAHHAIACLVRDGFVKVVITTNFDRLLEGALTNLGIEPTVIRSDDDLLGAVPLAHSRCTIIKVHGDYLDTRIRNVEEELRGYSEPLNALLDRILDEHGLIVCGWSADWDEALRAALRRTRSRRYPIYWAGRGNPTKPAQDLISDRKAIFVPIIDADSFFDKLAQRVETQTSLQRTNPASTQLLIATAKRYLARPEYRIRLYDLGEEEVRRLKSTMGDTRLGANGAWTKDEIRWRVAKVEAVAEPLVCLFGALGRWGDESVFPIAMDALKYFGRESSAGGTVFYLELQRYPAVLLLYAYGLGLLRSGRFAMLREWLSLPIELQSRGERRPAVRTLFLFDWRGGENGVWQMLEGLERRKAALSDHLFNFLYSIMPELALDKDAFELLFERFELLAALQNGTLTYTKAELSEIVTRDNQYDYGRTPIGRTIWNWKTRQTLFDELKDEMRSSVLSAGFCHGDQKFLDEMITSLTRLMSRLDL